LFFLGLSVFLFFGGAGLTQAKNRAARATQKQVPVARLSPAPRISIEPPGRRSRRANPRSGWGFGAGLLSSWGFQKKKGAHHTNFGKAVHHFVFVFLCFSGEARFLYRPACFCLVLGCFFF
jgi:hypothetical protein